MKLIILVVTLIVLSLLLTGCTWIEPPPDILGEAYRTGAIEGCIATLYVVAGPPPSDEALLSGIMLCQSLADELQALDDEPVAAPMPTRVPGSEL